jgi:4-carboxymuconolactone decarboxylase
MPWIPYVEKEQAPPEVRDIYERSRGLVTQQIQNNMKQWANSPKLPAKLLGFAGYLIAESELDPRLRELAVMRTLRSVDSGYAYSHHVILGLKNGLTEKQIKELDNYKTSPVYDELQRLVVEYAEELTVRCRVSDGLFWKLQQRLKPKDLIDLTMCIGLWSGMGRIINVFRPMPEPEPLAALEWSWK